MRHLTDDIVLSVKDAVRNLRYAIRSEAGSSRASAFGEAGAKPAYDRTLPRGNRRSHMARFVDSVFTEVESGALALVSPVLDAGRGLAFPRPVSRYFRPGDAVRDEAAERLFAHSHYHAAKALLRGFGLRNMLIFEHAIGRARDAVRTRLADLVGTVCEQPALAGETERVRLCAALTCALVTARPIKEVDFSMADEALPRGLLASPNAYCFTVLGLATAIASLHDEAELPPASEILESANAVVDVRFERFAAALEGEDPAGALALEFEEVLPFLP
jgi:hypothetical protein